MPLDDSKVKTEDTYLHLELRHEEAEQWLSEKGWDIPSQHKGDWMLRIMCGNIKIGYIWYQYVTVLNDRDPQDTMALHAYVAPQFRPTKWSERLIDEIHQFPTMLGMRRLIGGSEHPKEIHQMKTVLGWKKMEDRPMYFTLLPR